MNMGKTSSKAFHERKSEIIDLSNSIATVDAYNITSYYMFDDGIYNLGRIEVWNIMSWEVYNHLPPDQRISLNTYFISWMITFFQHLPDEKERLQSIQALWVLHNLTTQSYSERSYIKKPS